MEQYAVRNTGVSMSRQNVELARAVFRAWNARDLDTLRELYDPNVVVWATPDWPEPGPFVGIEAVIRQGEQLRETWDSVTLEPIGDFIDAGDRVAVRHIWRTVGHGPEATDPEFTLVITIRKGKILSFEYFRDYTDVLEILGLPG
jgi:ketosteroid isomerase-like protein